MCFNWHFAGERKITVSECSLEKDNRRKCVLTGILLGKLKQLLLTVHLGKKDNGNMCSTDILLEEVK